MKQLLLSVGKRHDTSIAVMIDDYTARIHREVETSWQFIKPSGSDEVSARRLESAAILSTLKYDDLVVLCDEKGMLYNSPDFAERYEQLLGQNRRIVFILGGAYGVDDTVHERADLVWSFSTLVFPHQLARLLLVEQLYRARMISRNHPYHHS